MVDFINEVEEELRKDKYNQLLRKFGPYIVAVIIFIVAATGYNEYNKKKTTDLAKAASASFVAASNIAESGDLQGGIEKFLSLAELAPEGYAGLSLTRAAGLKVQLGDMTGAVSLFDQAAEKFESPLHKDLASLKSAYILLSEGRYDDVQARATTLAASDRPYTDLAKEILAHAVLETGDKEAARTQFAYLSVAPGVLRGVQERANQSLALLNADRPVIKPDLSLVEPTPQQTGVEAPVLETPDTSSDTGTDIPDAKTD